MEFMDLTPQPEVRVNTVEVPESDIATYHDADLANFLSRPIRIANITWSYKTNVSGNINPWDLFFTDTRVKNRLAYYNLLKCKLCVKFLVNGNAFQYGQMYVDYLPLSRTKYGTSLLSDTLSVTSTTTSIYPNAATHRNYIVLRPLDSQGSCMELPFFYTMNYMSIPNEDWAYMGQLYYYTVNPVLHANNSTATDPPIISVFAWAEDVEISVPTSAPPATLLPQAGTEVVGKISGPATSIAKFAGSMATLPYVGPYAKASSLIATAIGSVAKMFGYSRPPIETPVVPMRPDYSGNISNVDRPEFVQKLTLDSSQEVSIDPAVTGINFGDELLISSIAKKETYLTQFTWDFSQTTDTPLFWTAVTPLLNALVTEFSTTRAIYPTAVSFASMPFRYWRGSLKFRFEVVCSKFHKGRLRFMYDPKAVPTVADFNKNYQNILDLDSSTDLTVVVNWAVPVVALNVGTVSLTSTKFGTTPTAPVYSEDNGCLYVYVLNNLSVPSQGLAASDCLAYVNVYVSAGDDFEVAVPATTNLSLLTNSVPFVPASGTELIPNVVPQVWEIGKRDTSQNKDLITFGERVLSFRSLLKRYVTYCSYYLKNTTTTNVERIKFQVRRYPLACGNDSDGVNTVANLIGTSVSLPGNYLSYSLINHIIGAFSGMRGSMRFKYQFNCLTNTVASGQLASITRQDQLVATPPAAETGTGSGSITNDIFAAKNRTDLTYNGSYLIQPGANPFAEIEDPYYEKYRFINPKSYFENTSSLFGGHIVSTYQVATAANSLLIRSWIATGEDFNLMYYTGPGILYTSLYY